MQVEPDLRLTPDLRDQLEAVLAELGEGITVQGPDGALAYANDAAAELCGFASAAELLSSPVDELLARFELLDETGRPLAAADLPGRAALRGDPSAARLVCYRLRATGEERWSLVHAIPIKDDDGRVLHAVNVFREVTAERQAQHEREDLLRREQAARAEAEQAAESLRKLEEVTQSALRHLGMGDLLDAMLEQVMRTLAADTAAILLLDEDGRNLTVRAAKGFDREIEQAAPVPFGQGMAGRVAASNRPVLIEDLDQVELASPHLRLRGIASLIAIPIAIEGRTIGVAHAGSTTHGYFDAEDLRLLNLMADRIALAVAQASLYEAELAARREAEVAQQRLSFLAEASTVLASSLDYESTLQTVARMVVPYLADWCAVHVLDGRGRLARVAVAHASLTHDGLVEHAAGLDAPEAGDPIGPHAVLRSGSPELAGELSDELLGVLGRLVAPDDAGLASYMCVPMHGRDRVLGTITFASDEPARYTEGDLALAEELARRTAVAVETAVLYRQVEERAQAARVLAAVGDGVFLVDSQGIVRLWNPAAEAITGLPAHEVVGHSAAEAIPSWAEVSSRVPVTTELGRGDLRTETIPLDLPGRERWLSLSGVGFSDGTVYAFRDLTQDRMLDELKSEFVATVSHELRTPLAAIYGAAMTLQRPDLGAQPEHRDKLLGMIVRESERLAAIVEDILWTSRLDAEDAAGSLQRNDAAAIAADVLESAEIHRPPNVELGLTAPEELPPVTGDPEKIRQLLVNLLDNAIKYSPEGGRVEVELSADNGSMRFAVHDEGLGVPPAEQQRIFERFYRLDPNLTRGVGGTGLGLYICRELVRRLGGRIWVVSPRTDGKGSTFAFELPLAGPSV